MSTCSAQSDSTHKNTMLVALREEDGQGRADDGGGARGGGGEV